MFFRWFSLCSESRIALCALYTRRYLYASVIDVLELTSGDVCRRYHLRGVIYFAADHFTARVITNAGKVWYHDGLFTGQSLIYEQAKPDNLPNENVIVGIYLHSPEQNSDVPCTAAAHY